MSYLPCMALSGYSFGARVSGGPGRLMGITASAKAGVCLF